MTKEEQKELLLLDMKVLNNILSYYLENPFDDKTHIQLNNQLIHTQISMKLFYDEIKYNF